MLNPRTPIHSFSVYLLIVKIAPALATDGLKVVESQFHYRCLQEVLVSGLPLPSGFSWMRRGAERERERERSGFAACTSKRSDWI